MLSFVNKIKAPPLSYPQSDEIGMPQVGQKVQFEVTTADTANGQLIAVESNGGRKVLLSCDGEVRIQDGNEIELLSLPTDGHLLLACFDEQKDHELCLLLSTGQLIRAKSVQDWKSQTLPQNDLIEAQSFDQEIFALDSENQFHRFYADGCFSYARPDCLQFSSPQCWTTLKRAIAFAQENKLFLLNERDELIERSFEPYGPLLRLCPLKNNTQLAVLTGDGRLLSVKVDDLSIISDIKITEFNAMTVDSLRVLSEEIILAGQSRSGRATLIDLHAGEEMNLKGFDEGFIVHVECDGIRLISPSSDWMIVKMPEELREAMFDPDVYNTGKTLEEAARSLLSLAFEPSLQDEKITQINSKLAELKDSLNEETFTYLSATVSQKVAACHALRHLQSKPLSLSLTPTQFLQMGHRLLIDRLCRRNLHFEAFEIAIQMEWDLTPILTDWCLKMISTSRDSDASIWQKINDKIMTWGHQRAPRIDFLALAEEAIKVDRPALAARLLRFQPTYCRRKIELLVLIDEYGDALRQVVAGRRAEEIEFLLDCLLQRLALTAFLQLTHISPAVRDAVYAYCTGKQPVLKQILLYQDDRLDELLMENPLLGGSSSDAVTSLTAWFKLLRVQRCFEKRSGLKLLGKSQQECLELLQSKRLAKDFSESLQ